MWRRPLRDEAHVTKALKSSQFTSCVVVHEIGAWIAMSKGRFRHSCSTLSGSSSLAKRLQLILGARCELRSPALLAPAARPARPHLEREGLQGRSP